VIHLPYFLLIRKRKVVRVGLMECRREGLREGNKRNGAACEVKQAEKLSGTLLLKTALRFASQV